jgi:sensor histidine kinase regulating citrate/malate metabolism
VKEISVQLQTGGIKGDGVFFVDKEWVIKALRNLLENSMEAVTVIPGKKKGGTIQVSLFEGEELLGILSPTMVRG